MRGWEKVGLVQALKGEGGVDTSGREKVGLVQALKVVGGEGVSGLAGMSG